MRNGYDFIINNMAIISAFALGWFLIGIVVGLRLSQKGKRKKGGKPRSGKNFKKGKGVELYVGNLSYNVSEKDLRKAFEVYGKVIGVRVIVNKFNGKSKGYGFVEMKNRNESSEAVDDMSGSDFKGRRIVVNEAKSKSTR